MNAQFLSSITLNDVTFTCFRQILQPEEIQNIQKVYHETRTCQMLFPNVPMIEVNKFSCLKTEGEERELNTNSLRLREVLKREQMDAPEKIESESGYIKMESDNSSEYDMILTKEEAKVKFERSLNEKKVVEQRGIMEQNQSIQNLNAEGLGLSDYLKLELNKIVSFLLKNMGKVSQAEIENMRRFYSNNTCLVQIYDRLVMKYFSAKRCREDIVRYILRRAFKEMKMPIIKEEKLLPRKVNIAFYKKYFQNTFEKLGKSNKDIQSEEEIFELIMPYTKKSQNRTMNTTFVLEIFESEKFSKDYLVFLEMFDKLLAEDNDKKKDSLLGFLMECIKKDTLEKIGNYKRLPWLDTWIQQTKDLAVSLSKYKKSLKRGSKRVKAGENLR